MVYLCLVKEPYVLCNNIHNIYIISPYYYTSNLTLIIPIKIYKVRIKPHNVFYTPYTPLY